MTTLNKLSDDIAQSIATELDYELQKVCPVRTGTLKGSIKVTKDGDSYVISMIDYWKHVEYLSNPFIRYTLNTKMDDILKRVTTEMSK